MKPIDTHGIQIYGLEEAMEKGYTGRQSAQKFLDWLDYNEQNDVIVTFTDEGVEIFKPSVIKN